MTLNCDAPFSLQVHVIQHLLLKIPLGNGMRKFKQSVGKGRFAMINVCDDTEIAYIFHRCKYTTLSSSFCPGNAGVDENLYLGRKPGITERSTENGHCTLEYHFLVAAQGHHIHLANVIIYPITARLVCILVPAIPVDLGISG